MKLSKLLENLEYEVLILTLRILYMIREKRELWMCLYVWQVRFPTGIHI